MSDRSTINSGLPHDYLHENLISLFSAAMESSFSLYLSPVVVFFPAVPTTPQEVHYGKCTVEEISLGTRAKFDLYNVQYSS